MSLYRIFKCGLNSSLIERSDKLFLKRACHVNYITIKFVPLFTSNVNVRQCHSNNSEIVYVGPLTNQIKRVKLFSLITSISGLCAQPVIYERLNQLEASTPVLVGAISVVGFFTFLTPLMLHFVTKKYVTQITHDAKTDTYTATVFTIFLRRKEISFCPGEPITPDVLGMFTSMTIRGMPLFIDAKFFDDVEHYKRIMGYDKPIDLKLNSTGKPPVADSQ